MPDKCGESKNGTMRYAAPYRITSSDESGNPVTVEKSSESFTNTEGCFANVTCTVRPGVIESYTFNVTPVGHAVVFAFGSNRQFRTGIHSRVGPTVCHDTANTFFVPAGSAYADTAGLNVNDADPIPHKSGYTAVIV
jgi:hypothetical protein